MSSRSFRSAEPLLLSLSLELDPELEPELDPLLELDPEADFESSFCALTEDGLTLLFLTGLGTSLTDDSLTLVSLHIGVSAC